MALIALVALGGFVSQKILAAGPGTNTPGRVHLVIDFGKQSKIAPIDRWVEGFNGTGWTLIQKAGLSVEGTADYPTSFVCRIAAWPPASTYSCEQTPNPAIGYWKYFVTNPSIGSGWIASGIGAAGHKPICGGAEGWLWVTSTTPETAVPAITPKTEKCSG